MRAENSEKPDRLRVDPTIANEFGRRMANECHKKVLTGELTEYRVIEDNPVSPRKIDIPAIIAINEHNGLTSLQTKVFNELKHEEKRILRELSISEEDYERSQGGIRIAFGRTQMERRGLI